MTRPALLTGRFGLVLARCLRFWKRQDPPYRFPTGSGGHRRPIPLGTQCRNLVIMVMGASKQIMRFVAREGAAAPTLPILARISFAQASPAFDLMIFFKPSLLSKLPLLIPMPF
jgi:hypothetical protein